MNKSTEAAPARRLFPNRAGYVLLIAIAVLSGCARTPEQRARQHTTRGDADMAKSDYKRAVIEYKIASQNTPGDPESFYRLGMASLAAKDGRGTVRAFEKALALDENHKGALYQFARIKAGSNQPEILRDAEDMLAKLLGREPSHAPALYTLSMVETRLGKPAEALKYFAMALALRTDRIEDIRFPIQAALRLNQPEVAKELVSRAEAALPNSPDVAALAAEAALLAKDQDTAATEVRRALSLNPRLRPALELQIRMAQSAGRGDDVEAAARTLSDLPDAATRTTYAEALILNHKPDRAVKAYQALIARYPDDRVLESRYIDALNRIGRQAQARSELDQRISRRPKRGDLLLLRARLNLNEGRVADAGRDLGALEDLKYWNDSVAFEKARYHGARGETMEEGNLLSEVIKLNPRMLSARLRLSRLLTESGKPDEALNILDGASPSERAGVEYRLHRNTALMASGDWDQAAKSIQEGLKQGRTTDLLIQDAALRIHAKDLAGAGNNLEEVLKQNPGELRAISEMAAIYRAKNQPREYLSWLERYGETNPTNPSVQIYVARVLRSAGDAAGARRDLNRAVAQGTTAQAAVELATLDIAEGKADDARKLLEEDLKRGDNARSRALLADIYVRKADWTHAEQQLRAALALTPSDSVDLINLAAVISKDSKRLQEAAPLAERALAMSPGNPAVESAGGWVYYMTGRYSQAIPHLEASLRSADVAATRYRLAAACFKAGDTTCATAQYELAVKQNPHDSARTEVEPLLEDR